MPMETSWDLCRKAIEAQYEGYCQSKSSKLRTLRNLDRVVAEIMETVDGSENTPVHIPTAESVRYDIALIDAKMAALEELANTTSQWLRDDLGSLANRYPTTDLDFTAEENVEAEEAAREAQG